MKAGRRCCNARGRAVAAAAVSESHQSNEKPICRSSLVYKGSHSPLVPSSTRPSAIQRPRSLSRRPVRRSVGQSTASTALTSFVHRRCRAALLGASRTRTPSPRVKASRMDAALQAALLTCDGWSDVGRTDERTDGRTDGRTNGRTEERRCGSRPVNGVKYCRR